MRALIVSDIHANLEALEAVLAATAGQYDTLWNLGDLVGYGGSPNEVIDLMRPLEALVVRGNHDRVCCGLTSPQNFNPTARSAAMWTREALTTTNLEWLREVPQGPIFPADSRATCVHGSPLDEDSYILNMRDAWAPLQQMITPVTFFGHTHVQGGFSQKDHDWHELRPHRHPANGNGPLDPGSDPNLAVSYTVQLPEGTRHLINPGSVGQPRDRDWRAACAILEPAADGGQQVTFYRVPYDLPGAQGRILQAGLPERLASRLREGR
jgi:predicted phosphodiesterase